MSTRESDRVLIAPSLMCADQAELAAEVRACEEAGADLLHFDIMDAHFVPNMPMGLGTIRALRERTRLPFDIHLMVERNDWFVSQVVPFGVERIAVHAESSVHLDRTLAEIRRHGVQAGVALNPGTPLDALEYVLERVDFVLLMTVNPGFSGQEIVPQALRKLSDLRRYLEERRLSVPIEVDGNVSFENIADMVACGAGILVGGSSSAYRAGGSRAENIARMREEIARGLERRATGGVRS